MVEFALILPLFVLFIAGTFELGRVFFSFIAITNAAREGTRVVTFWPGKTTMTNVVTAVKTEIGSSPMVNVNNISSIQVECGNPIAILTSDVQLKACPTEEPIRVTVTYKFDPILTFFFSKPLMLTRSAEMMVP
jgi:Flp pilus assembly protein TadG